MIDVQDKLKAIENQAEEWIKAGRDPRVVRWQAALESAMIKHEHLSVPGEIITVESLTPEEIERFRNLQLFLDLPPFVWAMFLPCSIAGALDPLESGRIAECSPQDTNKILVTRIGDFTHILAAEISPLKPGINIYEKGSQVGSHTYNTAEECISDLSKIIWIHMKHKTRWTEDDYTRYTEAWFFRSAAHKVLDLPINTSNSYIHRPFLLNLKTIPAIYKLMRATLARMHHTPETVLAIANAANLYHSQTVPITREGLLNNDAAQTASLRIYLDEKLLGLLKLLRGHEIINFTGFSEAEQHEFKTCFARTLEEIFQMIMDQITGTRSPDGK
jgi:hypothetical protein